MPGAILQRHWSAQPQAPAHIDRGGRGAGVIAAYIGGINMELVSRQLLTLQSGAAESATALGRVGTTRTTTAGRYCTQRVTPSSEMTLLWYGSLDSTTPGTGDATLCGITYDASNSSPYVCGEIKWYSTTSITFTYGVGASFYYATKASPGAGKHLVIGRFKSGAQDLWLDGVQVATGVVTGTLASTSTSRFEIGDSLNARNPNAVTALAVAWNRYLTDNELMSLNANPWQVFVSRKLKGGVFIPSATVPYWAFARRRSRVIGSGVH